MQVGWQNINNGITTKKYLQISFRTYFFLLSIPQTAYIFVWPGLSVSPNPIAFALHGYLLFLRAPGGVAEEPQVVHPQPWRARQNPPRVGRERGRLRAFAAGVRGQRGGAARQGSPAARNGSCTGKSSLIVGGVAGRDVRPRQFGGNPCYRRHPGCLRGSVQVNHLGLMTLQLSTTFLGDETTV